MSAGAPIEAISVANDIGGAATPAPPSADPPAVAAAPVARDEAEKAIIEAVREAAMPLPTRDRIRVVTLTDKLDRPTAMVFMADGSLLVAEKRGRILPITRDGAIGSPIGRVPRVMAQSQGGLLDLALDPDFASNQLVYYSYAERLKDGTARTTIARSTLKDGRFTTWRKLYQQHPSVTDGIHFGSRVLFGPDGRLYATLGERSHRSAAQRLDNGLGKVIRIEPDGKIPSDNPFVGRAKTNDAILSYGHRNPVGAAFHPLTGALWISENGPQGGDEINLIKAGANYGWPRITYGREYGSGDPIGEGTEAPDVEAPLFYWVPYSIGPSGMVFYTGDKVPALAGSLLVGATDGRVLIRMTVTEDKITEEERLLDDLRERIRDVAQSPDGYPYLLTDSGRLLRIEARVSAAENDTRPGSHGRVEAAGSADRR
ncbi:MAG: PQQ-dependent sugar dehydrogenase [Burkholderiaceae bacterium]